jgi:hypothetical protein
VIYNSTVDAKEEADAVFFILDTKSLSEDMQAEFNQLEAEKRTQDRGFVDGLSPEKYAQITESYKQLNSKAIAMLNSLEQSEQVVDTFKGAGTKMNEGIIDLASTMAPLEREEKEEISQYAPLLVSSLAFFSVSSLAIFVFLFAFATFSNLFRNKFILFVGILLIGCSVLFAGVISGSVYYVLESSSTDASFTDFQGHVLSSPHVSILVETEGVHTSASNKMMECADELAGSFVGKEVIVYQKTNSECIVGESGITLAECYNSIEEPIVVLQYSTVDESPQFTTGFVYKGTFAGDEEYFRDCQVAQAFLATGQAAEPSEEPLPGNNETE